MPPLVTVAAADSDAALHAEQILRSIPEWFGIESAKRMYIDDAARLPTFVAYSAAESVGFLTLQHHYPKASEIHCIAVRRDWHGRAVGTTLLRHAEAHLRERGVEYLQVKTQGPSRPCHEYARTLHFYESRGFVRVEEFTGLWPGIPALLLIKRL